MYTVQLRTGTRPGAGAVVAETTDVDGDGKFKIVSPLHLGTSWHVLVIATENVDDAEHHWLYCHWPSLNKKTISEGDTFSSRIPIIPKESR